MCYFSIYPKDTEALLPQTRVGREEKKRNVFPFQDFLLAKPNVVSRGIFIGRSQDILIGKSIG